MNWETILPAAGGVLVSIGVAWANIRKTQLESKTVGEKAGAETAKGQYAIWEQEWKNIVAALERRVRDAETSEREMFKELTEIKAAYKALQEDNDELKRTVRYLERRLAKAGIPNGSNGDENGAPK